MANLVGKPVGPPPAPGSRNEYADRDNASRQLKRTKGWQVASIEANANAPGALERSFIPLTQHAGSQVVINCYKPGQFDEMHCHPGSEHTFLVWSGRLHIMGVEEGEEMTLGPGEFAHVAAGYYYQLHNPGPEPAVYCQFRTVPAKLPKRTVTLFKESRRGKQIKNSSPSQ